MQRRNSFPVRQTLHKPKKSLVDCRLASRCTYAHGSRMRWRTFAPLCGRKCVVGGIMVRDQGLRCAPKWARHRLRAFNARCFAALSALCVAALVLLGHVSDAKSQTVAAADSSPQSQQEAVAALPLDKMTPAAQAKLWPVVSNPSIYRRLPAEVINCDRDMYLTLIRNPEIIASIWHLMDVTDLQMTRTAPFMFNCDDKAGTTSQVELVYGTADTHIFYADTLYEGAMFARPVKGRVVLLLRSTYHVDGQGRPQVKSVMDAFICIDHITAKLVARTLSPLVVRTADHNFVESFRFVGRVHESAEENGPGMRGLAARLEGVDEATQRRFADVATLVSQRAVARHESAVRALSTAETSEPTNETSFGTTSSANALPRRPIQLRR